MNPRGTHHTLQEFILTMFSKLMTLSYKRFIGKLSKLNVFAIFSAHLCKINITSENAFSLNKYKEIDRWIDREKERKRDKLIKI